MDMSNFRPDQIHVAQQTRRDKLRFHNGSNNMEVYANNMNQTLPSHDNGLNHENATFRNCRPEGSSNICYDPSQFCSEIPNNFNTVIIRDDPQQYFSTWKSIGSQSTTDWVANQGPNFVGEGPGPSLKIINTSNIPTPLIDNQSSEISDMHCGSNSSIYHNTLQELVTSSNVVRSFVQHPSNLISDLDHNPTAKDNSNTQALSLSLSSLPSPKVHATTQIAEYNLGNARQDVIHRNPGPLGPFTGYATILRSSKFLRPAQVLLDELCCGSRCKNVEICRLSDQILEEVRVCGDSSGSLFGFNGLNDRSGANGGTGCWVDSYHQPVENLQKKAKLLYMQDEVCKRYKQYHQQMQIVVSSFESVAGLSAATPYVSLALKTVSKHFRCLKNAITDQLKSIRNALGEELLTSPNSAGTSTNKGDANVSMLKFFDHSFQKQKGAASLGINLDSQHVWRPQRGLPERAVSILRAWLFDHFLHPYPTDTDKHMLATQTGLTRNQVSNWFINARVRVWKPMVEEIHMLETKGVAAADQTRTLDPQLLLIVMINQITSPNLE
ncbi:hypothetical protein DH2020_000210 [Rehmannia glutinosa]|uniref:Homeobox domain-containing protein n=1 Tax=Rehmannia glutinosa TaxID=99300 RepID=A0ABR0XW34_REHGL